MKITLEINDIDYGAFLEQLLPYVREQAEKHDGAGWKMAARLASLPPSVAAGMLRMVPQETLDEIAVDCLQNYREKICQKLTEKAEERGVSCRIDRLDVQV